MMFRHSHKRNKLNAQHSRKTTWTIHSLHPSNKCRQNHTQKKSNGGQTMSAHTHYYKFSKQRRKKKKKTNNDNKLFDHMKYKHGGSRDAYPPDMTYA